MAGAYVKLLFCEVGIKGGVILFDVQVRGTVVVVGLWDGGCGGMAAGKGGSMFRVQGLWCFVGLVEGAVCMEDEEGGRIR